MLGVRDQQVKSKQKPLRVCVLFVMMLQAVSIWAQTIQTVCSFDETNGNYPNALTLGNDGNFYGTTQGGGITNPTFPFGFGTVFEVTTNGTLTTLAIFNNINGANPSAGLTLGNDGNFYGTTQQGGITNSTFTAGMGTIFEVTTNGILSSLLSFGGTNGAEPAGGLTLGNDGNFYGTTYGGGFTNSTFTLGFGTIFKVTTNGNLTTLVAFKGTNGANPLAALTLGNDGNFYGTTDAGGITNSAYTTGLGTVFRMTTNGMFTSLASFAETNGQYPRSSLTSLNNGAFYGTTAAGGMGVDGTIFQITTNGALTMLVSFAYTNGNIPYVGLTIGNDGNFYGTTFAGGAAALGNIFLMTTNLVLTTLASFNGTNGEEPFGLTLGRDGNFYGVTAGGGAHSFGTVFCLTFLPDITSQPMSQTDYVDAIVTFAVDTTGPFPVSYQWQKNSTNLINGGLISGANSNVLTIGGISDSDAANYSVIVSNSYGMLTSSNAVLTVNDMPFIATEPQSQVVILGNSASFNTVAYGAPPFLFQWYFNGTPVGSPTSGTNYSSYTIMDVGTNQAGIYTVQVVNDLGRVTSSNAVLTVAVAPVITTQPINHTNVANTTAFFSVTTASALPLSYQWQQGGTNLVNGGKFSGVTNSSLTIASVSSNESAIYSVIVTNLAGITTSSNALLTVIYPPSVTAQPAGQLVLPGTNVSFGFSVHGTPPFIDNWRFNGTNILNATNVVYNISPVATNKAGNYSVVVSNLAGSVTSSVAGLTVLLPPTNQVKIAASTATFTAIGFGPASLTYQWERNGTNLVNGGKFSGVTTSALTITGVSSNEMAVYAVTVTNAAGSVTSSNATLTVIYLPVFVAEPLSQSVVLGNGVSFNVAVSGTAPIYYQWLFNAGIVPGATNAVYAIQAVGTNNAGNYSVIVTNLAGSVASSNALLTVLVPPSLALQLSGGYPLLNLNGMVGNSFMVQYNTNLATTNWTTLLSLSNLLMSPYEFLDPAGSGSPARFYRAVMQ